jgi:hypothetical protein
VAGELVGVDGVSVHRQPSPLLELLVRAVGAAALAALLAVDLAAVGARWARRVIA